MNGKCVWDVCVSVCVLVSLLILHNLHALPLFLLLLPLTVDEEPPQQEQQQKQPQKVGEKKAPIYYAKQLP